MGHLGLHHRGNVRLRLRDRQRTGRQATAATALAMLAMSWDGVNHCLHMHCGSADAGAAGSRQPAALLAS